MRSFVRSAAALTLSVLLATGCTGVGERAAPATTSTTQSSVAVPAAAGTACDELTGGAGGRDAVAAVPLSAALPAIPATHGFAGIVAEQTSLAKRLSDAVGLTVFVPVDAAFGELTPEVTAQLADPTVKQHLIEYAVVPSVVVPADVTAGAALALTTLRGPGVPLTLTSDGTTLLINSQAQVLCGPISYGSGVIYLTDEVTLPAA